MATRPRVALDVDGTLANTYEPAFELIEGSGHGYTLDDIDSWEWGIEMWGEETFLSAIWDAWAVRPYDVPPMEDGLDETVARLREHYDVDIVTAHPNRPSVTEGKEMWLDAHDIEYNNFIRVPMWRSKARYAYGHYIDDKPSLPVEVESYRTEATVFLPTRRYNRDVEATHVPVATVDEATAHLIAAVEDDDGA